MEANSWQGTAGSEQASDGIQAGWKAIMGDNVA
jgi:hypothetical protein